MRWSRGYRPGGINRRGTIPPYQADFLTNYEIGWKTTLAPGFRFNGAVYRQDWKNFQFSFLGQNSFTEIHNGPNARIYGIEADAAYHAGGFSLSASAAYTDAKTRGNICLFDDPTFTCTGANLVSAPKGTRLPITPKFKTSATLRYDGTASGFDWFLQSVLSYQSSAASDLRYAIVEAGTGNIVSPAGQLGRLDEYALVDLSGGVKLSRYSFELFVTNVFDERAELSRFAACGSCGQRPYVVYGRPRTFGIRAGTSF